MIFVDDGVLNERSPSWGAHGVDMSDFLHLPPRQRREARERKRERMERWTRAKAVRETWSAEQHEDEARRIESEIAEWQNRRDSSLPDE